MSLTAGLCCCTSRGEARDKTWLPPGVEPRGLEPLTNPLLANSAPCPRSAVLEQASARQGNYRTVHLHPRCSTSVGYESSGRLTGSFNLKIGRSAVRPRPWPPLKSQVRRRLNCELSVSASGASRSFMALRNRGLPPLTESCGTRCRTRLMWRTGQVPSLYRRRYVPKWKARSGVRRVAKREASSVSSLRQDALDMEVYTMMRTGGIR